MLIRCPKFVSDFCRKADGNIAIITALVLVPLLVAGGGAIDVGNVFYTKSSVQAAADNAALVAVGYSGTDAERKAAVDRYFAFNTKGIVVDKTKLEKDGDSYIYTAEYAIDTRFLKILDIDRLSFTTQAAAAAAKSPMDIVLVLDSSGSMSRDGRMTELKKAVSLFLSKFKSNDQTQAALVPFDTQVKATATLFGAVTNTLVANPFGDQSCSAITDPLDRDACYAAQATATPTVVCSDLASAEDRRRCSPTTNGFKAGTYGITFTFYGSSTRYRAFTDNGRFKITREEGRAFCYYRCRWLATYSKTTIYDVAGGATVPASSKDNDLETANNDLLAELPGPWPRCFIDRSQPYDTTNDAMNLAIPATTYPEANCATDDLEPITGLTKNLATVDAAAQRLTPSGNTNITIGVQWGMEAFTPAAPFTGAQTGEGTRKVMILLTDGNNTQNRWYGSRDRGKVDERTLLACQNAKAMDIEIYTIRLIDGNEPLLKQCASDPSLYHSVAAASELENTFSEIALKVQGIRLVW